VSLARDGGQLSAPVRISASLLRLMLPPETTHTILPVPARPDSAAAGGQRPCALSDYPDTPGERSDGCGDLGHRDRRASSTSGWASGHTLSSTPLPPPSTDEGR
jgi:hypothetical protein